MNIFTLKLIAITAMVISHIGNVFFPNNLMLYIVGRLAFPIFAWMIANGARKTANSNAYIKRILIFAMISQVPYLLTFRSNDPNFFLLNVLFILSLGLISIRIINSSRKNSVKVLCILSLAILSELMRVDFGALGIFSIIIYYLFYNDLKKAFFYQLILYITYYTLFTLIHLLLNSFNFQIALQYLNILGLFSFLFISNYNHKQGPKLKYLFYLIYPIHLAIFYVILKFTSQ